MKARRSKSNNNNRKDNSANDGETAHLKPIAAAGPDATNPHDPTGEYRHYRFPTLDLLQDIRMNPNSVDKQEQDEN